MAAIPCLCTEHFDEVAGMADDNLWMLDLDPQIVREISGKGLLGVTEVEDLTVGSKVVYSEAMRQLDKANHAAPAGPGEADDNSDAACWLCGHSPLTTRHFLVGCPCVGMAYYLIYRKPFTWHDVSAEEPWGRLAPY